jgi:hypothetical protein
MKDIKRTLLGISPTRVKRRLGKVAIALLFTTAAVTCSLTIWASPSVHGRALEIAETPTQHSEWWKLIRPIPLEDRHHYRSRLFPRSM